MMWRCLWSVLAIWSLGTTLSFAQNDSSTVRLSGSIGASYDLYSMTSSGATSVAGRRPASVFRLTADPTIEVGDWLEIPIRMAFTFREASVIQPALPTPDLASFLQNPMNRLSISPRIGWATVHLGTVLPRYSSLTIDNAQVFGLGIDLAPETQPLRVNAVYGVLARPVSVDTSSGRPGSYARTLFGVRIGTESESGSRFGVTYARMRDQESSIPFITRDISIDVPIVDSNGVVVRDSAYSLVERDPLMPLGQEGVSLAIDVGGDFSSGVFYGAELAGTAFTRDSKAPLLSDPIPVVDIIMPTRTSTRMDLAGKVEGGFRSRTFGIRGGVTYIGPGYVSLSQPFLQQDRIDVTVSPNVVLADGRVSANATIGWRMNDVIESLGTGSTQLLLNVSGSGAITDALTLSGSFSNYGFQTTRADDTLRYEQISTSFNVMPTYTITSSVHRHLITLSYGLSAFTDLTPTNVSSSDNTTTSLMGSYAIMPRAGIWSARITAAMVDNDLTATQTTMRSVTVSGRYRFFDGTLTPDAALTYGSNVVGGLPAETQLTVRAGAEVSIVRSIALTARLQQTMVSSEDQVRGRSYSEFLASFGIRWRW